MKGFKEKYVIVCNSMRGKGDYKNGKIYKIWSLETDKIYIGSTCDTLTNRMCKHRTEYKYWKEGKKNNVSNSVVLFDLVGIQNCKIEWVKDFPCETKKQLNKEEGIVQRQNKDLIVNKCIAGRSYKEWKKDNNDILKIKKKEYYQDNKQELNIKNKEYQQQHKEQLKKYNQEYRDTHKEHLKIKKEEYRDTHKEEIKIKRSQKMTCECGDIYTLSNKARHLKSQKHQNFIKPQ